MRIRTITKPQVAPALDFEGFLGAIGLVATTVTLVVSAITQVKEMIFGTPTQA